MSQRFKSLEELVRFAAQNDLAMQQVKLGWYALNQNSVAVGYWIVDPLPKHKVEVKQQWQRSRKPATASSI